MSKNRRRSAPKAEIEEQLTEVAEAPTSRRRSAPPPETEIHPTESQPVGSRRRSLAEPVDESQPARGRRRSTQPAESEGPADSDRQDAESWVEVGRGRRRPVGGEDQATGSRAEMGRRRSGRVVEVGEPPVEVGGVRPSRRRSSRPVAVDEPVAERTREPSVAALSGQLPHGAEHRAGEISTEAGRYLRMAARDDAPAKFGAPAGELDDAARRVWEIAFGLAVQRRFDADTPLAEISRTVATAVHEHAAAALPMLDAEMLVRHALGEIVPVGDLDSSVFVAVHLLLFASITDELALVDEELDAIIAAAEEKSSALVPA